jgi:hypothetical protein
MKRFEMDLRYAILFSNFTLETLIYPFEYCGLSFGRTVNLRGILILQVFFFLSLPWKYF